MQTASNELRDHEKRRAVAFLELVACLTAGAALWRIAGQVETALPEAQTVFIAIAMAFGFAFARFLAELASVLAYFCPRCDGRFHLNVSRPALRIRSCAHCGLSGGEASSDPSDRTEAPPQP